MHWGTQKFMWSVLLQYSLYFCCLEPHLQHVQGMPVHKWNIIQPLKQQCPIFLAPILWKTVFSQAEWGMVSG